MNNFLESDNFYMEWESDKVWVTFYPKKYILDLLLTAASILMFFLGFLWVLFDLIPDRTINQSFENEDTMAALFILFISPVLIIHFVIYFLWRVSGEQEIELNRNTIVIEKRLGFTYSKKEYELDHVIDLRIISKERNKKTEEYLKSTLFKNVGFLSFYYKRRKVRFGLDITLKEAQLVLNKIKEVAPFTDLKFDQ